MYVDGVHFIALIINYINVKTAILDGGKVKLTFVGRSGSNQNVSYYTWQLVWALETILCYTHAQACKGCGLSVVKSIPCIKARTKTLNYLGSQDLTCCYVNSIVHNLDSQA